MGWVCRLDAQTLIWVGCADWMLKPHYGWGVQIGCTNLNVDGVCRLNDQTLIWLGVQTGCTNLNMGEVCRLDVQTLMWVGCADWMHKP